MAYLAKEPTSWAAASWTVGLSSALLLGTTNYAALYYLLASNLFLIPQRAAGVAQRSRSGRAFSLEKGRMAVSDAPQRHNRKRTPPLVVEK